MILSNDDVKIITTHFSPVLKVFHVDFDKPYHFMSLSDNGEIVEWIFDKNTRGTKEIEKCNLQRPSDEILSINKHEVKKLKKGDYIKITCVIQFDNFLTVGYDDGLILVYQIEKQNVEVKKPVISQHDKIEEENQEEEEHDNKNKDNKKLNNNEEENSELNKANKTIEEIMTDLILSIDYYNTFSLYFILLGHSQQIRSLYYVPSKKVLVTSSDNCTVKIYDMTNGFSLYHFNLDCVVNKITLIEKRNSQNLILLSEDPYKLIIDITKEPFSFNHYSFKYNDSLYLEQVNNGYYLLGPKMVYFFDQNFEYKGTFTNLDKSSYSFIKTYKEDILLFDNDNFLQLTKFESMTKKKPVEDTKGKKQAKNPKGKNDEKQEPEFNNDQFSIWTEFKVKIGTDIINDCYIYDKFAFCSSQDNNLYLNNLEKEKEMKYERKQMAIEDEFSLNMMKNLGNIKIKKKGKAKDTKKKKK